MQIQTTETPAYADSMRGFIPFAKGETPVRGQAETWTTQRTVAVSSDSQKDIFEGAQSDSMKVLLTWLWI